MDESGTFAKEIEMMREKEIRLARRRKELKAVIQPLREELMSLEERLNKLEADRLALERLFIKPKKVNVEKRKTTCRKVDPQTAELLDIINRMGKDKLNALFDCDFEGEE